MKIKSEYTFSIVILLLLASFSFAYFAQTKAVNHVIYLMTKQSAITLANTIDSFRTLYTREVIEKLKGTHIAMTHKHHSVPLAVPLPATISMELGEMIGKKTGAIALLYSPYPFPWRKDLIKGDTFRENAWEAFKLDPNREYVDFGMVNGQKGIRYARADIMKASCVDCHNNHPDSPKKNWKIGDIRGIIEISQPITTITQTAKKEIQGTNTLLSIIFLINIIFLTLAFRRKIKLQRTQEEIRLVDKNNELNRKNEELEQFAYRSSHDLKGPLTTIKGFANYIHKDIGSGDLQEAKNNAIKIVQNATRLEKIVIDLLNLAKADLSHVEKQFVDFQQMLDEIKGAYLESIEKNNIELNYKINLQNSILCEETRIRQVLENLISNAIKYYDHKKQKHYIEINIDESDQTCIIAIKDNGIGIPQEKQKEVFSVFKRFHTHVEGNGLGLSLVKRQVEKLKGKITFESSQDGTLFKITIPKT